MEEQNTSNILIKVRIFDKNIYKNGLQDYFVSLLIYSLMFLLLSNSVTLKRDKSILYSRTTMIILIFCLIIAIQTSITSIKGGIGLFAGLVNITSITHVFDMFIFLVTIIILQLTGFYPRTLLISNTKIFYKIFAYGIHSTKTNIFNKMSEQYTIIEYPLILLFVITGASFLISSNDIVSIFLAIELQSYGLYLICTVHRNSELSTSAGLMYFLLGGLSSCIILLGTSLLYINYGSTNLESYYLISSVFDVIEETNKDTNLAYNVNYINISLLIMSIGFMFKISAAPFHFWSPDVYDAIPTVVTTFVAIVAKISILVFLLELIHYTNSYNYVNFSWTYSLLLSSFLSLIIGTILGLNQLRIKKLLAYSTISHLGFILLAISINTLESVQAFIFYIMQYSITNLNAFLLLITIGYTFYFYTDNAIYYKLLDKNNSPVQYTSQLKGCFYINPMLTLSLSITIFSFIGIPPLIGFFAKQMVLSAALDEGYIFLVLTAILTSVISAVYYLNLVKQMFFDKSNYNLSNKYKNIKVNITNTIMEKYTLDYKDIKLSSTLTSTISILTLIIVLFMFNPQEWLNLSNLLALMLYNK